MWNKAQSMLKEAMDDFGVEYYEAEGEAAFYGPKLDVQVRTALGKVILLFSFLKKIVF